MIINRKLINNMLINKQQVAGRQNMAARKRVRSHYRNTCNLEPDEYMMS